jgi:hypothetical protein
VPLPQVLGELVLLVELGLAPAARELAVHRDQESFHSGSFGGFGRFGHTSR